MKQPIALYTLNANRMKNDGRAIPLCGMERYATLS